MPGDSIFPEFNEAHYNARFGKAVRRRDGRTNAARAEAHRVFDKIWRGRHMTRSEAYLWLALQIGLPMDDAHMGMMTREECQKVIDVSQEYLRNARRKRRAQT